MTEEQRQIEESLATGVPLATEVERLAPGPSRILNPLGTVEGGPRVGDDDRVSVTANVKDLNRLLATFRGVIPGFLAAGPREYLHFDPCRVRVGILTAGGVCPGLNTVVDQIVRRHWLYGSRQRAASGMRGESPCPAILGFVNGFRGVTEKKFFALDPTITESWPRKGGSMLRQLREPKDAALRPAAAAIATSLRDLQIDILYVAGGDGSLRTVAELVALPSVRQDIAIAHIPKTMDNDIPWITQSFGFETAVGEAARLVNALRDEAESNNRVGLVEILGANLGHTAAHTALASGEVDAVLIPEENPIDFRRVLDHLDERALGPGGKGYALILASEGVTPSIFKSRGGDSSLEAMLELRFNMPPIERRVFINQPNYYVRAVPANHHDQLYCRQLANCAVDAALAGLTGFSISRWLDTYVLVPPALTAGKKKTFPLDGVTWKQVMNLAGQPPFRV